MKRRTNYLFIGALALLASACATKYGKEGLFSNGYSDFRCAEDTFVVSFRANEYTKPEKAMQFALFRASELTLKNGYRYFTILEQSDTTRSALSVNVWTGSHSTVSQHHYPSLYLRIKCFREKPSDLNAIEAQNYIQYTSFKID